MKLSTIPLAFVICVFIINSAYCQDDGDNNVENKLAKLLRNLNEERDVNQDAPSSTEEEDDEELEGEVDEKSLDINSNNNDLIENDNEARAIRWCRRRFCFYVRLFGRRRRICVWLRVPCRG